MASEQPNYPRLTKKGSLQDANAWVYFVYSQLVKKQLRDDSPKYRIVNDVFIYIIIQFTKGEYAKRLSVEATTRVKEIRGIFLQFRTFTYIRVSGSLACPKKLPRYPSDRLILLEIA